MNGYFSCQVVVIGGINSHTARNKAIENRWDSSAKTSEMHWMGTQASAMLLNYSWLFEGFGVINVGHGGGIG